MKTKLILLIAASSFVLNCLTGCAAVPRPKALPLAASHIGVDQAIAKVHASQIKAAAQVAVIEQAVTDPKVRQDIVDLHSTINDQGAQIDDAAGKIDWYEGQYQTLFSDDAQVHTDLSITQDKLTKAITGETYWRKRAQVILYALAMAFGVWFYKEAKTICVSPATGIYGLVIPFAAGAIGAAIGYAFGLYVLGWIAHFLP